MDCIDEAQLCLSMKQDFKGDFIKPLKDYIIQVSFQTSY